MYKIGEFSKINKISQRMLRYYDEKALLTPKKDEANGYRYYTSDDMKTVNRIKQLRNPNDSTANGIIQKLYPDRQVVGIDVRELYKDGGMIHCVTQQQPIALTY
ncbi:MerR family transcriptional regulator [Paenibacillus ehimensis]|uniref:MerR family transcriptional regulator n=1 Tax=Paenibacillus ehimensis TaxID=79264 RepID=UPI002DB7D163|nr:MerR family transcriptional regulator [Paenibacillus ehimensis]MEC0210063.1 MerR family transcriptional regulator [Paenibacillus ehimensis]